MATLTWVMSIFVTLTAAINGPLALLSHARKKMRMWEGGAASARSLVAAWAMLLSSIPLAIMLLYLAYGWFDAGPVADLPITARTILAQGLLGLVTLCIVVIYLAMMCQGGAALLKRWRKPAVVHSSLDAHGKRHW